MRLDLCVLSRFLSAESIADAIFPIHPTEQEVQLHIVLRPLIESNDRADVDGYVKPRAGWDASYTRVRLKFLGMQRAREYEVAGVCDHSVAWSEPCHYSFVIAQHHLNYFGHPE